MSLNSTSQSSSLTKSDRKSKSSRDVKPLATAIQFENWVREIMVSTFVDPGMIDADA